MKFKLFVLIALSCILLFQAYAKNLIDRDTYVRDRVVLLYSGLGTCTGVEIKTPSGKLRTLSAGHCADLSTDGTLWARTEDDKIYRLTILSEDKGKDLLLLTGIGETRFITVAKGYEGRHQKLHTVTHGNGMPAYRTDGELLKEMDLPIIMGIILGQKDLDKCLALPGTKVQPAGFFELGCIMTLHSMITTAKVLPGSSGGPALNDKDELIGIVSNNNSTTQFSGLVTMHDIIDFLKDK